MKSITAAATVLALAGAASVAGAVETTADAAPARAKFVKCGKYDLGFTNAKVKSRGMKCSGAKGVFKKWQRKVDCGGDGPCTRVRVENFVCRFGGTTIARLRCEHRFRDRAMKARWGD